MKNIFSCSFGKDSIANVLLALENNIKIDYVVYSEVMFSEKISGEHPEHIDWINGVAIPKLKSFGVETLVLRDSQTYLDLFFKKRIKGKNIGKFNGFPYPRRCFINKTKVYPIKKFKRMLNEEFTDYIGIAVDEPYRIERLKNSKNRESLLVKFGLTEKMALEKCNEYGLVSPMYSRVSRIGCWFCPNQKIADMACFKKEHPELFESLLYLGCVENKVSECFRFGETIFEVDKKTDCVNRQVKINFEFINV